MKLCDLINKLHKYERNSSFVYDLFSTVFNKLSEINKFVKNLKNEFFFDTLNISIPTYEKLLKLTPFVNATNEDRQSAIWAKWRANGKNTIRLIQDVCNSWKRNEIEAQFLNGKIYIKFINQYGVPRNFNQLLTQIEEVKPAHIPILTIFRYLIIEEIHEVKTIEEMETLNIHMFEF